MGKKASPDALTGDFARAGRVPNSTSPASPDSTLLSFLDPEECSAGFIVERAFAAGGVWFDSTGSEVESPPLAAVAGRERAVGGFLTSGYLSK
jgi:hypothetical protein